MGADARFEAAPGRAVVLQRGDITAQDADAIVNAANSSLLPGGGVSGAIHRAGGPSIAEEGRAWVRAHGDVPTGGAAMTTGGLLRARHVIHAVGPVWHGGGRGEEAALSSAYGSALDLAEEAGLETVAFPSISTGIFGYPTGLAAPVALRAAAGRLRAAGPVREVRFVLFDEATFRAYRDAAEGLLGEA